MAKADADKLPEYGVFQPVAYRDDKDELRFIQRLCDHDERAFNELVEAYQNRVFLLVFRMLGRRDEAEDLVQDVFVQVFKAIGGFRGDSKLSTWIYRIAINLCKNRVQYLARRKNDAQDELQTSQEKRAFQSAGGITSGELTEPDKLVQGYQLELIVKRCMAQLEPDFAEVLILRDIEGLTYEEIMEITGLPEGTVKSRIHRARATLKAKVERYLGEKVE